MSYSIAKSNIKDVTALVDKTNEKLSLYPTMSKISWKLAGKYWIPFHAKDSKTVPVDMWQLDVSYDIKSTKYKYVGKLTVDSNGYYSIEDIAGNKKDCPFYWVKKPLVCDCCKVPTIRKISYIVEDINSKYLHQIGKECLNKYTSSKTLEEISLAAKLHENLLMYNEKYEEPTKDFIPVDLILNTIVELDTRNGKTSDLKDLVLEAISKEKIEDKKGEYSPYNSVFSS